MKLLHRTAAIVLAVTYLLLGSGALARLHDAQHALEDARQDAIDKASGKPVEQHEHDESNCDIHAQLHMPIFLSAWVPILVLLGLFVAFVSELAPAFVSRRAHVRTTCRGPPACM